MGVLRSAAHRRAESRFWGVFIFAVHRAFVLGLGARHRGIVDLSEGVIRCVTVFACYSSSSSLNKRPCFEGFIEVNNTGELPCRVSCGLACGVKYEEVNTEKRGETSQVFFFRVHPTTCD